METNIDFLNSIDTVFELTGRTGSGKTETAKQISEMLERKGKKAYYYEGVLFYDPAGFNCVVNQVVVREKNNELTRAKEDKNGADLIIIDEIYMKEPERREAYMRLGEIARQYNCKVLVTRQTDEIRLKLKPIVGV